MSDYISQNRVRQVFFILIILLLFILLFFELVNFLPALLGAITLYILMHKWMFYLTEKKKSVVIGIRPGKCNSVHNQ